MFAPIEPVQASAPALGLVRAALPIPAERWENGLVWWPERCPTAVSFDPCDTSVSEVQTVTITGAPDGGTFTLTYAAQTTAAIAFDATAATVLAALIALSNLAPGDVTVTGAAGGPYTVTFDITMGNVGLMTGDGALLTGGVAPAVVVAVVTQGALAFGTPVGQGDDGLVFYRPPAFHLTDQCDTAGSATGLEQRIRRQAEAVTSYMVARELWSGERSDLNSYTDTEGNAGVVNARLAGASATIIAGGFEPYHGLGQLEETARAAALGQDVWIHVPIEVIPLIANALEKVGNSLQTETGAKVVADAGYLGTNPAGAEVANRRYIYATGPVRVALGGIASQELIDHRLNQRIVTADRMFAAIFDPCVHFGLAVVTPTPA